MPIDRKSLLPPTATELERGIEAAAARIEDVPAPLSDLWDPATCPIEFLPWLAWALSVDLWDADWPEARKRSAIAASIAAHRTKGTRASIEAILDSFDELLELVEWFETQPRGTPHTFEIILPLIVDGSAPGGERAGAERAEAIYRDVMKFKPARSHFRLVQHLKAAGEVQIVGAGRIIGFDRYDANATHDPDPIWNSYLQTEQGEPIQAETGELLQDNP